MPDTPHPGSRTGSMDPMAQPRTRDRRTRLRWWVFTGVGAAPIAITGAGTLAASGWDVRLGPVVLIALTAAVAFGLLLEVFGPAQLPTAHRFRHVDPWRLRHAVPDAHQGRDTQMVRDAAAMRRVLIGGQQAALHDRLVGVAQDQVRAAYGLGLGDARSRELLGVRAHDLLTGPPRRLGTADVEHIIDRIEAL